MGLDIEAFEKIARIRDLGDGVDLLDPDNRVGIYVNPYFKERADGIMNGIYRVVGERFEFHTGSYTHYNEWRDLLSKVILGIPAKRVWFGTPEGDMKGPFCELINFSDCDGVFGPKTSLKLYQDFKDHELKFVEGSVDAHDCWLYSMFMQAFLIASKGGVVQFH